MKIEPVSTGLVTANERRVQAERAVQDVFASVLAEVGQSGYASSESHAEQPPEGEQITASWQNWLSAAGQTRYSDQPDSQQTLEDFNALMLQAYETKAYATPKAFLSGLNTEQLQTVQNVHRLVEPIQVPELTEEGTLNLLLPPPAQVDLNHDGSTQSGVGTTIKFPDSRTPEAVADAWYESTTSLSFGERAHRELQVKSAVLLANIHLDENGRFSHQTEPGDPDWINPLADPDFSYVGQAEDILGSLEYFKNQTPPDQYQSGVKFWSEFHSALLAHGAK